MLALIFMLGAAWIVSTWWRGTRQNAAGAGPMPTLELPGGVAPKPDNTPTVHSATPFFGSPARLGDKP